MTAQRFEGIAIDGPALGAIIRNGTDVFRYLMPPKPLEARRFDHDMRPDTSLGSEVHYRFHRLSSGEGIWAVFEPELGWEALWRMFEFIASSPRSPTQETP